MKLRTLSSKADLRSSTSLDPPGDPRKVGIGITITTTVGLIAAQLGDTGYGIPVAIGVANLLFSAALYWKMRLILNNQLQLVDLVSWFRNSVVRWFGCDAMAEALDAGKDVIGGFGPAERLGVVVVLVDERGDGVV